MCHTIPKGPADAYVIPSNVNWLGTTLYHLKWTGQTKYCSIPNGMADSGGVQSHMAQPNQILYHYIWASWRNIYFIPNGPASQGFMSSQMDWPIQMVYHLTQSGRTDDHIIPSASAESVHSTIPYGPAGQSFIPLASGKADLDSLSLIWPNRSGNCTITN
jgi:hypothetical protein